MLLSIPVLMMACRTTKHTATETKTIVTERTVETVRDSIITLPADSAWLMAYLECDSIGQINIKKILDYEKGKRSSVPKISIKDNVLTAYNECEELEILIKIYERYNELLLQHRENVKETIYINKLKSWQVVLMCMGVAFIFLISYNIYKFFKNIINGRKN